MKLTITKLPCPEHHGDWHDKPLKWIVQGPGEECQKFANHKDSSRYSGIRRKSLNQQEATRTFVATA